MIGGVNGNRAELGREKKYVESSGSSWKDTVVGSIVSLALAHSSPLSMLNNTTRLLVGYRYMVSNVDGE